MKEGLPQKTETNQTATTALETRWRALWTVSGEIANDIIGQVQPAAFVSFAPPAAHTRRQTGWRG
jgi:hypothetical protein